MDSDLFSTLEKRLDELVAAYAGLKLENARLREENHRLSEERNGVKVRIDAILEKLGGIENR